jgi:hypothetical protein
MRSSPEVAINSFQLAVLLDDTEKLFYNFVIDHLVFCAHCRALAKDGVEVTEICLTTMNDIWIKGRCRVCHHEVVRLFTFGSNELFYARASQLRKTINLKLKKA